MSCQDCSAARETSGLWRLFDPKCLHCGARLIQQIGQLPIPPSDITRRRRAVLADWIAQGHAEKDIRELVRGPLALEPVTKSAKAK
jgi:hypothetical protein